MIAIIDYNAGNIASVQNALARLGVPTVVTSDHEIIRRAEKVIFPGVGRAGAAMLELRKRGLDKLLPTLTQPFLGICLGLQLLGEYSEEDNTLCLGILNGTVRRFPESVKVPEIGWNNVTKANNAPILKDIPDSSYFYFVNSYYLENKEPYTVGVANYGIPFVAVVQQNNFYATQFHPEKSGSLGEQVLRNFISSRLN